MSDGRKDRKKERWKRRMDWEKEGWKEREGGGWKKIERKREKEEEKQIGKEG